jgi:hypothetical protein
MGVSVQPVIDPLLKKHLIFVQIACHSVKSIFGGKERGRRSDPTGDLTWKRASDIQ